MTFQDILAQVIDWLQRDKRLAYRALKRQFNIDDDYLDDLKDHLLFARLAIDEEGRGLVWTGDPTSSEPGAQRGAQTEGRLHALIPALTALLQRDKRAPYRTLKYIFGIDDALLEEIREDLRLRQLAIDEDGKVLVWIEGGQPAAQLAEAASTDILQDAARADDLESLHATPEAERRQLTVMFCDLADSTKLSQQLDPEDLREVVRAYQQTSAAVIEQFDGYIAQHLGDGLLIYFGWPRAHEDDAQRALHAGMGIVEAVTTHLNPRLHREKGVQLTVRLGVHTGPVVVGQMGGDGRQEHLATGETVNIAARLESLAQPNTVVVSHVTARLAPDAFELEDLGFHELKGVAEPMQVYRVLRPMEARPDEDEGLPDGGVFLIGRDEEVGLLLRGWEQSKEGRGQAVLISGEAGIGKSSLVAAVRRHVLEAGGARIAFRCSPYHTNSALYPVITHLEHVLCLDRDDTPGTKLDKLAQALRTTSLPLDQAAPLFAALLSIPVDDRYPALTLSPQQQRQQTLDMLVGWLLEEAERQPVLAVWEDLHWADPSTLEMLGLVLEQTPTAPMLNVLTLRPEFSPPWPTRSHMTPITLNRLERQQVEALITRMAGAKPLAAEVVEHIVAKTDGVPLYVEELTKMLLHSDLLREDADCYALTGSLSTVTVPDTLQDSLMARLDQLGQAKEIAQLGSVLGREFSYDMLAAMASQDSDALQTGLGQLVDAELLYQRGRPPRSRYLFKHALIQDAAYHSLLRSRRQQAHDRVAQQLEMAGAQPDLVAYHYGAAGQHQQAMTYWQQAGVLALGGSAHHEAATCFERAIEALNQAPEGVDTQAQAIDLRLGLRQALYPLGALERLGPVLQETEALAERANDPERLGRVLCYQGIHHMLMGQNDQAKVAAQRALQLVAGRHDIESEVLARSILCAVQVYGGQYAEVIEMSRQLVEMLDGELAWQYFGLAALPSTQARLAASVSLSELGRFAEGIRIGEEALEMAEASNHPYSITQALRFVGLALLHHGQVARAIDMYERGLSICEASGVSGFTPWCLTFLASAYTLTNRDGEAMAFLDQAMTYYAQDSSMFKLAPVLNELGNALIQTGRLDEAQKVVARLEAVADSYNSSSLYAYAQRLQGELFRRREPLECRQVEGAYRRAMAFADDQDMRPLQAHCHHGLGKLYQQSGQIEQARAELTTAIGMYRDMEMTFWLPETEAALAELEGQ